MFWNRATAIGFARRPGRSTGPVIALSYYRGGRNEQLCRQCRLTLSRLDLLALTARKARRDRIHPRCSAPARWSMKAAACARPPAPTRRKSPWNPIVVFDLDGTLADTAPDPDGDAQTRCLAQEGLPTLPVSRAKSLIGGRRPGADRTRLRISGARTDARAA